jgi:hypothetical protein
MQLTMTPQDVTALLALLRQAGIDMTKRGDPMINFNKMFRLDGEKLTVPEDLVSDVNRIIASPGWQQKGIKANFSQYADVIARKAKMMGADPAQVDAIKQDVKGKINSGQITNQEAIDAVFSAVVASL